MKDPAALEGFRSKDLSHPGVADETNKIAKCPTKKEDAKKEDAKDDDKKGSSISTTSPSTSTTDAEKKKKDDDDGVCFPASATVETEASGTMPISALSIGDRVRVGDRSFSSVFMFTHASPSTTHTFVRLRTASGRSLTATAGHYVLLSNRGMVPADSVRVGDVMRTGEGDATAVTAVESVVEAGLYNPQTVAGDIVVDGLVASTYTTAIEPTVAHALLAPLRAIYGMVGFGASLPEGSPVEISPVLRGAKDVAV